MKVCMVVYNHYEYDNRVLRYAEALVKHGHHVDVIALSIGKQPAKELIEGVQVFRIQRRDRVEPTKWEYLLKLFLFSLRSMFLLTRLHLQERYDVIHVHSLPDFIVFSALVPKLTGCKVILDIHDVLPELYASKFKDSKDSFLFKLLVAEEKLSAAFSDHVIIANHIWEKRLQKRSVPSSKLTTILNYPDNNVFRRKGRSRRDDGRFIIVFPGTLSHHQGVDIAIRAFSLIRDQVPEAEFHIYGNGVETEALKSLTAELGLQSMVHFKEPIPLHELPAVIENADLGIDPKRKEGFADEALAVKIFEFMSVGVPVIISDTTANRFYFTDSVVKFFSANSEDSLGEAILLMIRDTKFCETLVSNANKFVQNYMWDVHQHRYLNLVHSLVNSVPARATESVRP